MPERKSLAHRIVVALVTTVIVLFVLWWSLLALVGQTYRVPSESMEPTVPAGDRVIVEKLSYRFGAPQPGDVIVFRAPDSWNVGYTSIRSSNVAVRWVQNALSVFGLVPPDENDVIKRVIAVGGQTVACTASTGLTVDGEPVNEPYLDAAVMEIDPQTYPCLGVDFGPVTVPDGRLWVMGDNRTHSADSRTHCASNPEDEQRGVRCTGADPASGTVPVANVIGKVVI